jgi:hypothetical protein
MLSFRNVSDSKFAEKPVGKMETEEIELKNVPNKCNTA